jgi:hypothetical protein
MVRASLVLPKSTRGYCGMLRWEKNTSLWKAGRRETRPRKSKFFRAGSSDRIGESVSCWVGELVRAVQLSAFPGSMSAAMSADERSDECNLRVININRSDQTTSDDIKSKCPNVQMSKCLFCMCQCATFASRSTSVINVEDETREGGRVLHRLSSDSDQLKHGLSPVVCRHNILDVADTAAVADTRRLKFLLLLLFDRVSPSASKPCRLIWVAFPNPWLIKLFEAFNHH